jgi:hypothetical protein
LKKTISCHWMLILHSRFLRGIAKMLHLCLLIGKPLENLSGGYLIHSSNWSMGYKYTFGIWSEGLGKTRLQKFAFFWICQCPLRNYSKDCQCPLKAYNKAFRGLPMPSNIFPQNYHRVSCPITFVTCSSCPFNMPLGNRVASPLRNLKLNI